MRRLGWVGTCALLLALSAPAQAGEAGKPPRAGAEKGAAPVIGCPSLANYRALMREGEAAATALLADPKADHLGCATLVPGRITGIADRVVLAGQSYDCAGVQGTTACHWVRAGAVKPPPAAKSEGKPESKSDGKPER